MEDPDRLADRRIAFLRHVTSLALLALGGVLTFRGTILSGAESEIGVWLSALLFLFAGMASLGTQERLTREEIRSRSELDRHLVTGRYATYALLLGAGILTGTVLQSLI